MMILDSLHPEIRDALVGCCSVKAFDQEQFDSLVTEYGLADRKAKLVDEVYSIVGNADYEQRRQERKHRRKGQRPSLN